MGGRARGEVWKREERKLVVVDLEIALALALLHCGRARACACAPGGGVSLPAACREPSPSLNFTLLCSSQQHPPFDQPKI